MSTREIRVRCNGRSMRLVLDDETGRIAFQELDRRTIDADLGPTDRACWSGTRKALTNGRETFEIIDWQNTKAAVTAFLDAVDRSPSRTIAPAGEHLVCGKCGLPLRANAQFCSGCGAAADRVTSCPTCGSRAIAEDKFCGTCGTALPSPAVAETGAGVRRPDSASPPSQSVAETSPPATTREVPEQSRSEKAGQDHGLNRSIFVVMLILVPFVGLGYGLVTGTTPQRVRIVEWTAAVLGAVFLLVTLLAAQSDDAHYGPIGVLGMILCVAVIVAVSKRWPIAKAPIEPD